MAYLVASRYGLRRVDPTESEKVGGWKQAWEHPSGLRAIRHPVTGRWHVSTGFELVDDGFCSSLRVAALKLARLAG